MLRSYRMQAAVLLGCLLVAAQAARGADAAPDPVDSSSPKAALKSMWTALSNGDVTTAKSLCTGTEEQMKTIDSLLKFTSAMKKMQDAATAKFGKENALTKDFPGIRDRSSEIDKMQEKIEGDTATITPAEADKPVKLVKKEGKWLMDLGSMDLGAGTQLLDPLTNTANEMAAELTAGKYPDAQAAVQAYRQKMTAVLMGSPKAATTHPSAPSTRPAAR